MVNKKKADDQTEQAEQTAEEVAYIYKSKHADNIHTAPQLYAAWCEYKQTCDAVPVVTHGFSARECRYVSAQLSKTVSYSQLGFYAFLGCSAKKYKRVFEDVEKYRETLDVIHAESGSDALTKLETGQIPERLAGLLLYKYGYVYGTPPKESTTDGREGGDGLLGEFVEVLRKAQKMPVKTAKKSISKVDKKGGGE